MRSLVGKIKHLLLQRQIENGESIKEIKNSWKKDLKKFKKLRENYLLYN